MSSEMKLMQKELTDANEKLKQEASDMRSRIDHLLGALNAKDDELGLLRSQHAKEVKDLSTLIDKKDDQWRWLSNKMDECTKKMNDLDEYNRELEDALDQMHHRRQMEDMEESETGTVGMPSEDVSEQCTESSASRASAWKGPGKIEALLPVPPCVPIRSWNECGAMTPYPSLSSDEVGALIERALNGTVLRRVFELINDRRRIFNSLAGTPAPMPTNDHK